MKHLTLILAVAVTALAAPCAQAAGNIMKQNAPACKSKELFDRMATAKAEHDEEEFQKLLLLSSASNNCIVLQKGEEVFLEDVSLSGYDLIRRRGDVAEYWTYHGAAQ